MDFIMNTPGLQHIAENIFLNLNQKNYFTCQNVNTKWKKILESPFFWLKKCIRQFGRSSEKIQEKQSQWLKLFQNLSDNPKLEKVAISYLMKLCKRNKAEKFENPIHFAAMQNFPEIVRIVAPQVKNPNAPNSNGWTPIHVATMAGHTEIIRILAPLANNLNFDAVRNNVQFSAMNIAVTNNHTEIVKILAEVMDNPNAPDSFGTTPIHYAVRNGNTEIIEILAPLSDNPNAPNPNGITPIQLARSKGHSDVVRILTSMLQSSKRKILNKLENNDKDRSAKPPNKKPRIQKTI